jgi:Host cell surface-exposed lipoprotein
MTTTDTVTTQTPKPPRKRHTVRNVVLTVAALGAIGGIASAASGGSHPAASTAPAPKATHSAPAKPVGFAQVQGLLITLSQHGAACKADDAITTSTLPGSLAAVDCTGISSGDTVIAAFKDHASAVNYAQMAVSIGKAAGSPTAEVVGPTWTINTVPAFAAKAATATGGQLMTEPAATPAAPASQAPAAPATTAPATPPPPPAPAGPTASQQQALASAQGYLSDGQGFSRAGLIAQLDSPSGDQFSVADATWAVDNSGADWNAQALTAAKGYLSDGQGFSRAGLIAQLDSSSGGQFTYDQAVYGVDNSGADWNAQAVISAKGYMSDGQGFSRQGLIDQLDSPYGGQFTLAQATYAANRVGL